VPVLEAIYSQQVPFAFEVVVIDSGSAPADLEAMRRFPVRLLQIPPESFGHGRTRNQLAREAQGEVLLFLSQDARPVGSDWMATLVAALSQASVAGAYARQLPEPDSNPLMRFFLAETYGPIRATRMKRTDRGLSIGDMFFSNVSSAIRREVWERVPLREDVVMSEDQYWAHDVLQLGYSLVYEPAAQVVHAHNYSLTTLFQRNRLSGASLRGLIADSPSGIAGKGARYVAKEVQFLLRERRPLWIPYMLLYEATKAFAFALGLRLGVKEG
jgi:rhamnosyltransferase